MRQKVESYGLFLIITDSSTQGLKTHAHTLHAFFEDAPVPLEVTGYDETLPTPIGTK